ncbi:hypothetical protein [Aestuariivivens sediminis]|uniref:hypothetical protein n=1 Tax=Aestuariivivens sediminis TaxID=2913557 RepID=UPI001F580DD7|nr:hypothetical protein [Aestuariivivens sediminis]
MKYIIKVLVLMVLVASCKDAKTTNRSYKPEIQKGIVQEVIQVRDYSYIRVLEDGKEKWLAAPTANVEIGGTYYYGETMEMKNFESKELNRAFETIYFIEKISATEADATSPIKAGPSTSTRANSQPLNSMNNPKPVIEKKNVNVETSGNTLSIADLFKNKEQYNNKVVRLRGQVTKYNPGIMNVNWLHIQDGSEFNGEFDLTATTTSEVQVGDVVTLEGKVTLNKDFGAGYFYNIIVENATVNK